MREADFGRHSRGEEMDDRSRRVAVAVAPGFLLGVAGFAHPHHLDADTADRWLILHIVLLPVFPLLALGLLLAVQDTAVPRVARVTVYTTAYVYAVGYTALDVLAGIGAAILTRGRATDTRLDDDVEALARIGDVLGQVGGGALVVAALVVAVLAWRRGGDLGKFAAVLLPLSTASFYGSHIYAPVGVITVWVLAVASGAAVWACHRRRDNSLD